ncbi:hypothetical protein BDC45DRAFT_534953 [Circinella umbellata]|nr:hypothetical protein BDC45DRAFT_534953 [Circinella umbellata]
MYRHQVPLLNALGDEDFNVFSETYRENSLFFITLHDPSVELINVLERFGSRLHQYQILSAANHASTMISTIVETNLQQVLFTGIRFQFGNVFPPLNGIPQTHLIDCKSMGLWMIGLHLQTISLIASLI